MVAKHNMPNNLRSHFPFFNNCNVLNKGATCPTTLAYLDSAATTHKPNVVLDVMQAYHESFNANVHRGGYAIAQKATNEYEQARHCLADFMGAASANDIVFTSGTTEAINMIANGLTQDQLSGNKIVIAQSEHHANLVPWQLVAQRFGFKLEVLPLHNEGSFDASILDAWLSAIDSNTAILAVAHVSNALGNIYPVQALCEKAASIGAISVVDGTQAAAHEAINVVAMGCDFYALSGHKMYASTGIGCFYGKPERLLALQASKLGGEMVKMVTWESTQYQLPPLKFEGGTPNISGALSMAVAAKFIQQHRQTIIANEQYLYAYLCSEIIKLPNIRCIGNIRANSIATLSFVVEGMHAFDTATALANAGIAVRAGHHCAMPLMQSLNLEGCVRVSIACYNSKADIQAFISSLKELVTQEESLKETAHSFTQNIPNEASDSVTDQLLSTFKAAKDWNEKHRQLLLISKSMPILPLQSRNQSNQVIGCEANVWIALQLGPNKPCVLAYSDSKVVRGLLSVLLIKTNSVLMLANQPLYNIDILLFHFLNELGLPAYFSSGRKDGMQQVIAQIKNLTADI